MTGKERVRMAVNHIKPDRVPANLECVSSVWNRLMREKNLKSIIPMIIGEIKRYLRDVEGSNKKP